MTADPTEVIPAVPSAESRVRSVRRSLALTNAVSTPSTDVPSEFREHSARDVWRFRPVRRLLLANFALYAGVALQATALLKQAFDLTGNEADIGFIGLAEFVPAALLELKDQNAVIKQQIGTAIPLWLCNVAIIYIAGFLLWG